MATTPSITPFTSGSVVTVSVTNTLVLCNSPSGTPKTVNLPPLSQVNASDILSSIVTFDEFGDAYTNNVTVVPNGADTITGSNILASNNAGLTFIATPTTWCSV